MCSRHPRRTTRTDTAIPLTVVAGFLGSGKTTLVNHILRDVAGVRAAVLVNDFGALDVDAALIENAHGETIALSNGCVCCSIGGDLTAALIRVLERSPAPDWIVIEASGVSDPWPIAQVALADPALVLDGVIVLADAAAIHGLADDARLRDTILRQLAAADIIVLNKAELVAPEELESLKQWIATITPAPVIAAVEANVPVEVLTGIAVQREDPGRRNAAAHDHLFESVALSFDGSFDVIRLRAFLDARPPGVLRLKGVVRTTQCARVNVQYAGRRGRLRRLAGPPVTTSQLVAVGLKGEVARHCLRAALLAAQVEA